MTDEATALGRINIEEEATAAVAEVIFKAVSDERLRCIAITRLIAEQAIPAIRDGADLPAEMRRQWIEACGRIRELILQGG